MSMAGVMKMRWAAGAAALCVAGVASAQVPPTTIPDVGNFSLPETPPRAQPIPLPPPTPTPTPTPTAAVPLVVPPPPPRAEAPRPRATPTATPAPTATRAPAPVPRATAAPGVTPTRAVEPAPVPSPLPEALPAEGVTPEPAPVAEAAPAVILPEPAPSNERLNWLWGVLIGAILLVGAALFAWRRRSARPEALPAPDEPFDAAPVDPAAEEELVVEQSPAEPRPAEPVPPMAAVPAAAAPRFLDVSDKVPPARLELEAPVVRRAGINMITATADLTVEVRNASDVPARGVTLDVRLASAQPNQDAAIAAMFAGPVPRPAAPPFDLAPGESRRVRTLVTMARESITVLQAGGRPMFVPVVAIRALHAGGQTVSVHALGIERPGQAKLGPFWLDQPGRMFDAVGVRPHSGQW
ncbi:hypothetical protein SAMN05428950_103301 [Sphingomonas sp. OV641]|nr:hypothetical protein SAMN05428950_103301 [Sphingomonas sp. OV641]